MNATVKMHGKSTPMLFIKMNRYELIIKVMTTPKNIITERFMPAELSINAFLNSLVSFRSKVTIIR